MESGDHLPGRDVSPGRLCGAGRCGSGEAGGRRNVRHLPRMVSSWNWRLINVSADRRHLKMGVRVLVNIHTKADSLFSSWIAYKVAGVVFLITATFCVSFYCSSAKFFHAHPLTTSKLLGIIIISIFANTLSCERFAIQRQDSVQKVTVQKCEEVLNE